MENNTVDWRTELQPDSRQRIVRKIMDMLKKHLPFSGEDGLLELKKIAERFEEKIYAAANSQSDYLRKISLKMLTMETKSQNPNLDSTPTNQGGGGNGPPDSEIGGRVNKNMALVHLMENNTVHWRTELQPDSRQRIILKIMDALKKHLPYSSEDGLLELKKIAERFEEKIYAAASSQSDYLRKISLKMLTMETKSQNTSLNSMPTNQGGGGNGPPDSGSASRL